MSLFSSQPHHIIVGTYKIQWNGLKGEAKALFANEGQLWVDGYYPEYRGHEGLCANYKVGKHCYAALYSEVKDLSGMGSFAFNWAKNWRVFYGGASAPSVTPNAKKPVYPIPLASQKAKGLYQLTKQHYGFDNFKAPKAKFYPWESPTFPTFARPCPTVPRHGFVDSRLVKTQKEFNGIVKEIEATGEPVEIICMDYLEPDYSGVFTPSGITFGLGNDGATSGTSAKSIPYDTAVYQIYDQFNTTNTAVGIKPPDVPYGEFVGKFKDTKPTIVQLRGGPHVAGSGRYVPEETKVETVVVAGGDLLEWERKAGEFTKGTVVWHPKGALSSHYAVHCILHKIPVVCDVEPKVGDILKVESKVRDLKQADYNTIAQYLAYTIGKAVSDADKDLLKMGVATLHASPLWGNEQHLLVMRAEGVAKLFRYASAAVFGELRHFGCGHGPEGKPRTPIPFDTCDHYSREYVFKQIYRHNVRAILEALPLVIEDYSQSGWSGAYGGSNWRNCAVAVERLGKGIQSFLHKKNAKAWQEVMVGWNQTVNAVHNGGGLLTKHIDSSFLDQVAVNPLVGFVNGTVARFVLESDGYPRNLKPGKVLPVHSKKPALTLYPFTNSVEGFKKVFEEIAEVSGTFQATIRKTTYYTQFTLPYVTLTNNGGHALKIEAYLGNYPEGKNVSAGKCTVKVENGIVTKVYQNKKTHVFLNTRG